ncbi:MAG: FHA domain-containing protein [Planctomycetota bacterium]|jgi:pSer/pThr/pTyr-binding forkhead associated (FHA) protein
MPSVELQVGDDYVRCQAEKISLGRGLDCDVVLKSTHVSRHHALLAFVNGRWMARDLDSSNGTYLNRHPLGISDIHAGDVLRFGEKGPRVRVVALEPAPIARNLRLDVTAADEPPPPVRRPEPDPELTESTTS